MTSSGNKNSMLYWFPIIKQLVNVGTILVPKTKLIPVNGDDIFSLMDGKTPQCWNKLVEQCQQSAKELGLPVFLRTDHTSGKHGWKKTCFVPRAEDLPAHISRLVDVSACSDLPCEGFAVRELLHLKSSFHAHYGQMPVAREFRFFVRDGIIEHMQFYWPTDSVRDPDREDWKKLLAQLSVIETTEQAILEQQVLAVNNALPGYWSVDFAQDTKDRWWLIDMADGRLSFDTRRD